MRQMSLPKSGRKTQRCRELTWAECLLLAGFSLTNSRDRYYHFRFSDETNSKKLNKTFQKTSSIIQTQVPLKQPFQMHVKHVYLAHPHVKAVSFLRAGADAFSSVHCSQWVLNALCFSGRLKGNKIRADRREVFPCVQ